MARKPSPGPAWTREDAAAGLAAYRERHQAMEPDGLALVQGPADPATGWPTTVRGTPPPTPARDGAFFDVADYRSTCAHEPACR